MKTQERIFLIALTAGLSLLLLLRDVAGIEFSKFIYVVYSIPFLIVAKYETLVYMTCFMLPLVCGLPGTYIMPVVLLLLIIKKNVVNGWQIIMVVFVIVAEVFASLWYQTVDYALIVNYVSFAGVMFFLIHDNTKLDYLTCVRMYMLGVMLLCGTIITTGIMTAPTGWIDQFAEGQFRFGETQMEELTGMKLTLNANSLAYYSITGLGCGILLIKETKTKERIFFMGGTVLVTIAGLLSVSRSWLLVAALCLMLYFISVAKYPKRFLITLVVFLLLLWITSWFVGDLAALLEAFTTRLNEENTELGGGRTQIFQDYLAAFWANDRVIFLGSGVTQYKHILSVKASMHNGTQQLLVCYGIMGFIVMLAALIKPVIDVQKGGVKSIIYWLPWIGVVLFVQTIQFLSPMMLMLPYIISIYALKVGGTENGKIYHYSGYRRRQPVELETRE